MLQSDANVFCVELSARSLALLARGLRKEFALHARTSLPIILDKFKEKKQNVVNALTEALDAMHPYCFTLADMMDDVKSALENKVPSVRQQTLATLLRFLSSTPKPLLTKVVKNLTALVIAVLLQPLSLTSSLALKILM